jgi:hypothetical protein
VRADVFGPLDANLGAEMRPPWFKPPDGYEARRFEMDNGDVALFCWSKTDPVAYWLGNTETPSSLWRTDKFGFDEVPDAVSAWAERELLAQLHEEAPWLADYPAVSWFFLPVFLSKDGRQTTRAFFRDHAAGFPDAGSEEALSFYESFLATGVRASRGGDATLVEVTRPLPPRRRSANSPVAAVRETAGTKTDGQLEAHGGGVVLFVDCSSFPDDDWAAVRGERPAVRHKPAVVYRMRPDGSVEGYRLGRVPLDLPV